VWQYFVTVKKYRLVRTGNGQLSTRTRVILLWATPVGPAAYRAAPGITFDVCRCFCAALPSLCRGCCIRRRLEIVERRESFDDSNWNTLIARLERHRRDSLDRLGLGQFHGCQVVDPDMSIVVGPVESRQASRSERRFDSFNCAAALHWANLA